MQQLVSQILPHSTQQPIGYEVPAGIRGFLWLCNGVIEFQPSHAFLFCRCAELAVSLLECFAVWVTCHFYPLTLFDLHLNRNWSIKANCILNNRSVPLLWICSLLTVLKLLLNHIIMLWLVFCSPSLHAIPCWLDHQSLLWRSSLDAIFLSQQPINLTCLFTHCSVSPGTHWSFVLLAMYNNLYLGAGS